MTRHVKLGRTPLKQWHFLHHWAVKVGDTWYEIAGAAKGDSDQRNVIRKHTGYSSSMGAGSFGGETVGKTEKTDEEIERFNANWLRDNPNYDFTAENCQAYAIAFMRWLTNNNYRLKHEPDAADLESNDKNSIHGFACANEGQAYAGFCGAEGTKSSGVFSGKATFLSAEAEAIAGPGLGAWVDASVCNLEGSIGPVGGHVGINFDTGAGIRGGNLDVHLGGWGGKVGADGIAVDTPLGGVKVPNPVNVAMNVGGWL